jgi:hypothetical protein
METVAILPGTTRWNARDVTYYTGTWDALFRLIPEFEARPFLAGPDEPENPFLRSVVRMPVTPVERPIPVGTVSNAYALLQHRLVANLCRDGLIQAGVAASELTYELGLSTLGEWMHLRIDMPPRFGFEDAGKFALKLRLECFNSVDGTSRLVLQFGWYRLVCSNGMAIFDTEIEVREQHRASLDLSKISERLQEALDKAMADRARVGTWQTTSVALEDIAVWIDAHVSNSWGKKAACRVFHICASGEDAKLLDPFEGGNATEKSVTLLGSVPGGTGPARTLYDVSQALSYVASRRRDAIERHLWQNQVTRLIAKLPNPHVLMAARA